MSFTALDRRDLILTVAGLMLGLLLSALDQTIVGTAMPRIVAELQGFQHYAWVTTAYLLTSTAVVPVSGKLSDMYGRKMFLLGSASLFVLTSALCGLSQNMTELILFRGLQGLAGGVLTSTVFTVISQIFPPAERGRVQGVFSGIFGLASIIGPLLGGYLTDNLSWRWVFYVNLPVGIVALTVLWLSFPDVRPAQRRRRIDFAGALTLVAGVVPLLLALSEGGVDYDWLSPQIIGLFAISLVMLVAFGVIESRASEPIIPLSLFRNRVITVSVLAMTFMAIGMFGTILYIPLFIQGVLGTDATTSGTVLMPMMIVNIVSGIIGGQIISRTGRYKLVGLFGLCMMTLAMFLLSRMNSQTEYVTIVQIMVIMGLGMGPAMPVFTLAAQNSVRMNQLGVVTSLTQFARSIGSTIGVAAFGSLLTNRFAPSFLAALPPSVAAAVPADILAQFQNPQILLNPNAAGALEAALVNSGPQGAQLYADLFGAIRLALVSSLQDVFLLGAVLAGLGVVTVLFLKELPLRKSNAPLAPDSTAAQVGDDSVPSLPPLQPRDQRAAQGTRQTAA
ncbi:MAG: MFS transporter [Chloroflexi bacterium]|nr:MFS transporter [Chloroflexota bacterium]